MQACIRMKRAIEHQVQCVQPHALSNYSKNVAGMQWRKNQYTLHSSKQTPHLEYTPSQNRGIQHLETSSKAWPPTHCLLQLKCPFRLLRGLLGFDEEHLLFSVSSWRTTGGCPSFVQVTLLQRHPLQAVSLCQTCSGAFLPFAFSES